MKTFTKQTFEEFLQERFLEVEGTWNKDQFEAAYDRWSSNLDVQEVIDYAEQYGVEQRLSVLDNK